MPEENKPGDNGEIKPEAQPKEEIKELKLSITKNLENGHIAVQGPGNGQFYDKYICLGLLEDAKDFIKAHNARVNQSNITKANPTMAQQMRGMFRRR